MFALTAPIAQNLLSGVYLLKAFVMPSISIGSPSFVAVPCVSMKLTVNGSMPASSQVFSITSACASASGAVIPIELPS